MLVREEEGKTKLYVLSTGKPHISYSEFSDWYSCSYRHKLKYIDKILLESDSVHTIYGQVIHDALEEKVNYAKGKIETITPPEVWRAKFEELFDAFMKQTTFSTEEEKKKNVDLGIRFCTTFDKILENTIEWLDSEFGDEWEPVEAEVEIYEPLSDKEYEGYFKGFIDLIVRTPKYNKSKKKIPDEFTYWILDWKTTDWGWTKDNKASFKKQAQLLCYKNYYSRIKNIPMDDIKCGWILVKRKPKKGELPYELVTVPSSEEKVQEAIFRTRQMITSLDKELYFKNYSECLYCVYRPTKHCSLAMNNLKSKK